MSPIFQPSNVCFQNFFILTENIFPAGSGVKGGIRNYILYINTENSIDIKCHNYIPDLKCRIPDDRSTYRPWCVQG